MKKLFWIVSVLTLSFTLCAQEVAISTGFFNTLYMGIANPLTIVVENYDCDSISVSANMIIQKGGRCDYYVTPGSLETGQIRVSGTKNGLERGLGELQFRILSVPDPVAVIGRRSGGDIRISELLSSYLIGAEVVDFFVADVSYQIQSFTVLIERNEDIVFTKDYSGDRFSNELKAQFRELIPGDMVRFENLTAMGPGEAIHEVEAIRFKVR